MKFEDKKNISHLSSRTFNFKIKFQECFWINSIFIKLAQLEKAGSIGIFFHWIAKSLNLISKLKTFPKNFLTGALI